MNPARKMWENTHRELIRRGYVQDTELPKEDKICVAQLEQEREQALADPRSTTQEIIEIIWDSTERKIHPFVDLSVSSHWWSEEDQKIVNAFLKRKRCEVDPVYIKRFMDKVREIRETIKD